MLCPPFSSISAGQYITSNAKSTISLKRGESNGTAAREIQTKENDMNKANRNGAILAGVLHERCK